MPDEPAESALRHVVLAVSVLDDVDLEPFGDGVVLRDGPPVEVTWREIRRVLAGEDPKSELARRRVRRHLRARRWLAGLSADELGRRARPIGIPVGDPMHPGVDWVRERVLGGVLDLGYGMVGVGPDPDAVVVCPAAALEETGVDPADWWPVTRHYVERMGTVAIERLGVERSGVDRSGALRPIGDCDVVTLMASRVLRGHLCSGAARGLRTAAVPMRRRGWLDPARIDPAFAAAAAVATDVEERGFPRPLLLTVDEVTLAPGGGRPAEIVLRDAAVSAEPLDRRLRWR